jgi:hypothetical protein
MKNLARSITVFFSLLTLFSSSALADSYYITRSSPSNPPSEACSSTGINARNCATACFNKESDGKSVGCFGFNEERPEVRFILNKMRTMIKDYPWNSESEKKFNKLVSDKSLSLDSIANKLEYEFAREKCTDINNKLKSLFEDQRMLSCNMSKSKQSAGKPTGFKQQ